MIDLEAEARRLAFDWQCDSQCEDPCGDSCACQRREILAALTKVREEALLSGRHAIHESVMSAKEAWKTGMAEAAEIVEQAHTFYHTCIVPHCEQCEQGLKMQDLGRRIRAAAEKEE